jgi:hypothetical protein
MFSQCFPFGQVKESLQMKLSFACSADYCRPQFVVLLASRSDRIAGFNRTTEAAISFPAQTRQYMTHHSYVSL